MMLVIYVVGLVAMWVVAWGSLSLANVLGGVAVAAFLLWISPDMALTRDRSNVHPIALVKLAGFVLVKIVKSNLLLIRAIVSRRSNLHTGVMAVPLPDCSDALVTVIANLMALTPGTTPIHLTRHPTVLYVHVLLMHDVESSRREVQRLADLAYAAFEPGFEAPLADPSPAPAPDRDSNRDSDHDPGGVT